MPIENGIPSLRNPASLAAPHTVDIEVANNQATHNPAALDRQTKNDDSIMKWTIADAALHFTGHALALTMAAIQLAHRTNGLQTTAEKLAVPTALFNSGDLIASPALGFFSASLLMNGLRDHAAYLDLLRFLASGFGLALPSLVLANPTLNSAGKAHEVTAAVALGVIATAMIFTTFKWGRVPAYLQVPQPHELQLSAIDRTPEGNRAAAPSGHVTP